MKGAAFWRKYCKAVAYLCAVPFAAHAQSQAPLSVIDWLDKPQRVIVAAPPPRNTKPKINEPAVTGNGTAPRVTVQSLNATSVKSIGLVPSNVTGLPQTLWTNSSADAISYLLSRLSPRQLPAANTLLLSLLLAETTSPKEGARGQDALTIARVKKLTEMGAIEPALALIEQAGAEGSPLLFDTWAELNLLNGTEDRPCGVLSRRAHLTKDYGLRIFCAARAGDWETAALTHGTATALGLISKPKQQLLDRFLSPDLFETASPLPAPRKMDPLSFRLFESIGEPLPTRPLPLAYAAADLRDISGWKSQLEAAERLTRAGAIPDNILLGLYSDRKPAASGGIWDRVAAIQRFDTALKIGSLTAIAKTLPAAWRHAHAAELEVPFAALFVPNLPAGDLGEIANQVAAQMRLLSTTYEATVAPKGASDTIMLAVAVAKGTLPSKRPAMHTQRAVYDAFDAAPAREDIIKLAQDQQLGRGILETLRLLQRGAAGDDVALTDALATLRALGLEDTARRAAIQVLLLRRPS